MINLKSSEYMKKINWKLYNDNILTELCMDGIIDEDLFEDICSKYIKKYQIEIFKNDNENIDINRIIYNNNNNKSSKYKLIKYEY